MYTVTSTWLPLPGETMSTEVTDEYRTAPEALQAGIRLTCLRGVRLVDVTDPDSVVIAEWNRIDNLWREYPGPAPLWVLRWATRAPLAPPWEGEIIVPNG